MSSPKNFSERVRAYRDSEGLSQEELARRLGISSNYISMLERGKRSPSRKIIRLFEILLASPLPPAGGGTPVTKEEAVKGRPSKHELLRKALYIEEHGTAEQVAMLNSMIDAALARIGGKTTEESPEYPSTSAVSRAEGEDGPAANGPTKKIGFSAKKKAAAFFGSLRPQSAT